MTRWYPLAESDDDFLRSARFRFAHTVEVPVPPGQVWEAFTADDALVSFSRAITGAEWTSPRPFGVGTTRTVTVGRGAASLRERFYRWDEGSRMTFGVEAANRPGLRRFAEDVALEPIASGTRFTWTFAVEPAGWLAPVLALSRPLLRKVTRSWADGAARRATGGAR
ncbi:SRPBCC family protein [Saccharopolyspora gloriosae]|uniref:Uncharacterized protein YndB with AHSA1/START domain n=1 Tax=Saccharopolyspora gloriosae TaxID=455344 RepID=A0A840NKR1_9PSEU|nr:SRPBCC family protein [Saccharopolyspora gloriosae]MBB5070908.1 uncharacterized protein YndB with AHSA1/START domain [Saccharopolyspora gloriosae]